MWLMIHIQDTLKEGPVYAGVKLQGASENGYYEVKVHVRKICEPPKLLGTAKAQPWTANNYNNYC